MLASVGRQLADTGIDDAGMATLCATILSRSPAPVLDPTAYVVQAIRRDTTEWKTEAEAIAADARLREGNRF